jgi:hypothetical protein
MAINLQGPTKYTTFKQVRGDEHDLVRRALAAFLRRGSSTSKVSIRDVLPALAQHRKHRRQYYVVLSTRLEIVAVYRIRAFDGVLKLMLRPPKEHELEFPD